MIKVGDLVTVQPLDENLYLVVALARAEPDSSKVGSLWSLYGPHIGVQPMYEKWIEVVHESQ